MSGREEVWKRVEEFRQKHLAGSIDSLPVDVFTLTEIELQLNMIPFHDLFSKYGIDAALGQDFSGILVDAETYVMFEKGPIWKQNRLRFSVAHELGHYELHRELAEQQRFQNFEQFFRWIRTSEGQKGVLEKAANEFAGRLLVPRDRRYPCHHRRRVLGESPLKFAHEQSTKARIARVNILTKAIRAERGGRMRVDCTEFHSVTDRNANALSGWPRSEATPANGRLLRCDARAVQELNKAIDQADGLLLG
jgi:Zn-dependent peptidase ImmA (M78 family)